MEYEIMNTNEIIDKIKTAYWELSAIAWDYASYYDSDNDGDEKCLIPIERLDKKFEILISELEKKTWQT